MRASSPVSFAILPVLLLAACKHPVEAPADIDGLAHYFWSEYDQGSDEDLGAALANLDVALQGLSTDRLGAATDYQTESMNAEITDLSTEEAAIVLPGDSRDPAEARGMLVVNPLPCTVDQVERFTYDLAQDELYPDAYTAYDRAYTSDFDAYVARQAPQLTWTVDLHAATAGVNYEEHLLGGIRYVPAVEGEGFGPFVINRTWLTEPAIFESGDYSFDQDFQLEVQYENPAGNVIHFYVIWRQAEYFGMTEENDGLMNLQINGLLDWDDDTAALCEAEAAG